MAKSTVGGNTYLEIKAKLQERLEPLGFECHPFKVGWYNEVVKQPFRLAYHEDTVAFVILSLPSMFEKTFIPFLRNNVCQGLRDPIDECMAHTFKVFTENLSEFGCQVIHDFELLPNRRPKILVQTAAHISGAAYYYQGADVKCEDWSPSKHIFGVCIHPKYGGWFAIRGVLILTLVLYPELPKKEPKPVLQSEQEIIQLLEQFNYHWQDWKYRDIVPPEERYSEKQKLYFSTKPSERLKIIESIVSLAPQ